MRLIDADKAGAELACFYSPTGIVDEVLYEFASDIINEAPTVEAIQIEWINKYIDSTLDEGNSQMLGFKAAIIKEMIEEWEKENDR